MSTAIHNILKAELCYFNYRGDLTRRIVYLVVRLGEQLISKSSGAL